MCELDHAVQTRLWYINVINFKYICLLNQSQPSIIDCDDMFSVELFKVFVFEPTILLLTVIVILFYDLKVNTKI